MTLGGDLRGLEISVERRRRRGHRQWSKNAVREWIKGEEVAYLKNLTKGTQLKERILKKQKKKKKNFR